MKLILGGILALSLMTATQHHQIDTPMPKEVVARVDVMRALRTLASTIGRPTDCITVANSRKSIIQTITGITDSDAIDELALSPNRYSVVPIDHNATYPQFL